MRRTVRTLLLLAGSAALVAVGVAVAAPDRAALAAAAHRLGRVPITWPVLAAAVALAPALAEAIRIAIAGRVVGVAIAPAIAVDAAVANAFFTAITPATGLGEPSVAWILARRGGQSPQLAILVPFVKFTTSFVFVFAVGAVIFAVGGGPPGAWLGVGGAAIAATAALVMAGVFAGARARGVVARAFDWLGRRRVLSGARTKRWLARGAAGADEAIERLAGVRWRGLGLLIASHALYYAIYVAPIALLCEGLAPGTGVIALPRALGYLCMLFLAPTPGGAGIGEAAAGIFFGDLIGAADAVVVVLAYRVCRIAGQVVLPALYFALRGLRRPPSAIQS